MAKPLDEVPEQFYKYRPMNESKMVQRVENIVMRNQVYFAAPASFNDPFDLKPAFSLAAVPERQRAEYMRLSRKFQPLLTEEQHTAEADTVMASSLSPENVESTSRLIQDMHAMALSSVGVFCVSTKRDDILMWSHYADSHCGVCLEFDGMFPFMAHAQQVTYSAICAPINPYEDDTMAMMERALLAKSEHWKYEAEWRLISYQRGVGNVAYRPENLTGVILGAQARPETIETVRRWKRERSAPLKIYRARTSSTKFELEIHPG